MLEVTPETTPGWLAVNTHANREAYAIENLRRQDFTAYCPMIMKRIRHARRTSDVKRPLFPGYVFVEYRPVEWRSLLGTYGVRSIIRSGDTPSLLSAALIDEIRAREVDGVIRKTVATFKLGDTVTINGGAFEGLVGRIVDLREHERVLLLLDLLNQSTKVYVHSNDLALVKTA